MQNFTTLIIVMASCLLAQAQNCFPDGIMFNRQSQIDSFANAFPDCINILGALKIDEFEGNPITSLAGISQITNVGGDLEITNNKSLKYLAGLNNIKSIKGNLLIRSNDQLQSIEAFSSLDYIEGDLVIAENDSLENYSTPKI